MRERSSLDRRSKRPHWSLKSSFLTGAGILAVVSIVVLAMLRKSIWEELEIITLIMALIMFVYFTAVLYRGVRFDKRERFSIDWPQSSPQEMLDASLYAPDSFGFFTGAGAEAGILGIVIGFILDVLVTLVLAYVIACLFWLGINFFIAVIFPVSLPLFYFYKRALRGIITKGRTCRGNLGRSLMYAFRSTIGYSIWFYTIFLLAHYIQRFNQGI